MPAFRSNLMKGITNFICKKERDRERKGEMVKLRRASLRLMRVFYDGNIEWKLHMYSRHCLFRTRRLHIVLRISI